MADYGRDYGRNTTFEGQVEGRAENPDEIRNLQGELDRTQKLLAVLGESLAGLSNQLEPIMMSDQEMDQTPTNPGQDRITFEAPLVAEVRQINLSIARRTETVIKLTERVQL